MDSNATDKNERLRIHYAFWLSIFGVALAAALAVFLVLHSDMKASTSAEVVAIVGLFTSVTGTLVGAFFGLQIGAAGAENERRSRQQAEESRQRAEDATRIAMAHLDPDTAKDVLDRMAIPPQTAKIKTPHSNEGVSVGS